MNLVSKEETGHKSFHETDRYHRYYGFKAKVTEE
jgi:hypothetical protein